jgi:branched-chain amino acid transport system substrate-binding protein
MSTHPCVARCPGSFRPALPGTLILLSFLALSGCGHSGPATVRIGLEGPMTGDYAYEGKGFERAVRLLVDQANASGGILGRKVELMIEDDKGDAKEASLVADRLVSRGVSAVIGPYNSTATEAAAAVYDRAGVLQITPSSTATRLTAKGYQRFFRMCFTDDRQGLFGAEFITKVLKSHRVAVLHDNSTYAQGLADWGRKFLQERGCEIVFYDAINPADKDFTPTLARLKAANAETVYFTGYHAQAGYLLKQAPEVGLKVQWVMGDACNNPELVRIAGVDRAQGVIFTTEPLPIDLDYPEAKAFMSAYQARYGEVATSVWWVMAADAFRVIRAAIEATGNTDPKAMANYLHTGLKNLPGITGPIFGYDEKGDRLGTIHRAYVINPDGKIVQYPKQP